MSVMYDCAGNGCRRYFCRNVAMGDRLGSALEMAVGEPCSCTSDESGFVHACAACCAATAKRESESEIAQQTGWLAFLTHCAAHGGYKAFF